MHFAYAHRVEDELNKVRYQCSMPLHRNADVEAAMQYLIWALEDIERAGNQKAAHHARLALEALREGAAGSDDKMST
jgi:hypothetical protein